MLITLPLLLLAQAPGAFTIQQGDASLKFGSELRFRHETRDPAPPLTTADSVSNSMGRFRLSLDGNFGEEVRAFLQLQSLVDTDGGDTDENVHQAFAQINRIADLADLQVGRFEMLYADELLVSNGDWGRTGNAFDGVRLRHKDENFWADLFFTQPVEGQGIALGMDQVFGGVWLGVPAGELNFEGYGLVRDDRMDGGALSDDMTIGGRVTWAQKDGLALKAEVATQTGDHGALDAGGSLAMFDAGMTVAEGLVVGVNVLYASGDDNPSDGDDEAFKPLFHTPHKILGAADVFQLTNVLDLSLYSRYKVNSEWRLLGGVHWMTLAEEDGALPDLRGGLVKAAGEKDLGIEIDVMAWYIVNAFAEIHFGVSELLIGDAIAGGDDQLWAFAQLVVRI